MHSKQQSGNLPSAAIAMAATLAIAIVFALAAVPALAQDAVPPTARQAAADPAFAARLARQVPAQPATKSRAVIRSRMGSPQDQILYDNGPYNGTTDAWTINFGLSVSDSFTCSGACNITDFHIVTWNYPGDNLSNLEMQIGSSSFGNNYSDQVLAPSGSVDLGINQFGYQTMAL